MKKWTFLFIIVTIIWSCDNNDEVKVKEENKIIGNWELTGSGLGIGYVLLPPGGEKYVFNSDNTFMKSDLASITYKDEGTWLYDEDTKQLNFTFKTYNIATNEVSDTKLLTLTLDKVNDKELVLKTDYKQVLLGQFVEFKFDYYSKK